MCIEYVAYITTEMPMGQPIQYKRMPKPNRRYTGEEWVV